MGFDPPAEPLNNVRGIGTRPRDECRGSISLPGHTQEVEARHGRDPFPVQQTIVRADSSLNPDPPEVTPVAGSPDDGIQCLVGAV
mgnify:CR=1 FL=1